MEIEYSIQTIRELTETFQEQKILRPMRIQRYEPGTQLSYEVKGIIPANTGHLKLEVEKFIGGGYAGQVYKAKILSIESADGQLEGIHPGHTYAMKILIPPTGFSKLYRNVIYALGFQGPFSLQVNPDAARAGALWQKLIRQGAKTYFGSEKVVVNILATFIDPVLGSCGEISEWIDGRVWHLEVDDDLDARRKWKAGDSGEGAGSPEYRSKRIFMAHLVDLLHEMGAVELARQYEWWTLKSQPNVLKQTESDPAPEAELVAVDFRAGLAILPFLPMCPADFKLIFKGIGRGSLVQFDRGSIDKLQNFVNNNPETFTGMQDAMEELKEADKSYRSSLPDITHHHFKLIYSRKLWASIMDSSIKSWKIRKIIDKKTLNRLVHNKFLTLIFYFLGLIPILGYFVRRLWGKENYRHHLARLFTSLDYFRRAGRSRIAEILIRWHRTGRVDAKRAKKLAGHPARFLGHLPLSILPAKMHRFFSDRRFALQSLDYIFARPLRLYFKAHARERWLRELVSTGHKNGILSTEEAARINSQIKEPFIQKYLKSLAVHICTVPITQIVSIIVAFTYVKLHPELSWQAASVHAGIILGLFQVIPISPGSLVRGFYVSFLVLHERNFKDYNIAFYLSFLKYIGYLAFPIQMAYRYPDLARFMAGHWATGAAHIVPVFGEKGALLEHTFFDLFYNYPLTIGRRIRQRSKLRSGLKPRTWHLPLCVLTGTVFLALTEVVYLQCTGHLPKFGNIWWIALWFPIFTAAGTSVWAGGAAFSKRMTMGAISGALTGLFHAVVSTVLLIVFTGEGELLTALLGNTAVTALWRVFLFTFAALIGTFITETRRLKTTQ